MGLSSTKMPKGRKLQDDSFGSKKIPASGSFCWLLLGAVAVDHLVSGPCPKKIRCTQMCEGMSYRNRLRAQCGLRADYGRICIELAASFAGNFEFGAKFHWQKNGAKFKKLNRALTATKRNSVPTICWREKRVAGLVIDSMWARLLFTLCETMSASVGRQTAPGDYGGSPFKVRRNFPFVEKI